VYGQNVRQSLDYVARAEVEAGFVYATDAAIQKDKVKVLSKIVNSRMTSLRSLPQSSQGT
jgi:ABC-type molybdate transport system substrate-binding protein